MSTITKRITKRSSGLKVDHSDKMAIYVSSNDLQLILYSLRCMKYDVINQGINTLLGILINELEKYEDD